MATINTDLVLASVPQVDIAGAIGSGISSYYGVKEMQDAQAERDMLLEQRENELWASNKDKWIEYARSGFVSPQNVTDWIAVGQEDGIYDDSAAQMMRNEVGNIIDSDEYANITHLLDTANGTRKANMGLQSRMAELDAEMASYENIPITPMVQTRMSEINSEKQTLSTKIANNNASLAGLEEGLQMSSANAMEQYNTQVMGGIQGWIDEVVSATSDIEEIRLGTPKVLYRTDGDEVKEKIVATESDYMSSVGSGEWSTMEPVKETFFDSDGGEHFMFPEEAMDKGYTTDKPTVTEEEDVTGGYTGAAGQFYQVRGRAPESGEELAEFEARGEKTVADETELGALLREQAKYEPGTSEYKAYGAAIQKEVGTVTDTVSTGMADYKAIYGKAPATEKEYLDFLAGKAEATQQVTKPSLIREYQETHDGKTPNEEQFIAYLQRRNSATADTEQITVDADGNINITKGIPAGDLGVVARNTMEKGIIEADEAITRMGNIQSKYDPSYLKTPEMFRQAINTWKDKLLSGQPLSTEDSQSLRDYTEFRQAAYNNLNKTLNALSGAAISPAEAERLMEELPNPGKEGIMGVLTGDSPEQFESSLDAALATQRMIKARLMYMRNNGFEPIMSGGKAVAFVDNDGVNIGYKDMPNIMQEHADSLFDQYKKQYPKMNDVELDNMAFIQTQKHFGLR